MMWIFIVAGFVVLCIIFRKPDRVKEFDRDEILMRVFNVASTKPFVHRHFIYQNKPRVKCMLGGYNPPELYMHDMKKGSTIWEYHIASGSVLHVTRICGHPYKHYWTSDKVEKMVRRYRRNVLKIRKG